MSIPKLRFPQFRDAGEWNASKLGEITEFVSERIPIEKIKLANYVSTENILSDYMGVTVASKLPTSGSATRFRPNDTLVSNIRPYLKKVWLSDKEGGASNDVIVIRAKNQLLTKYFPFLLKNDAFINYVMLGAKGVKMPRGDISAMKKYLAYYPSLPEQQKIADCLSSLDELIAAHSQKLAALKFHKKGLMQQLFPAEGETVPRLRFPEFRDVGEWEDIQIGKRIEIKGRIGYRGYTVEDIVGQNEGAISLSPSNISDDGILKFDKATYLSWEKYNESPEIMLQSGYIVLVKTGSTFGKVAYVHDLPCKVTVNPQIVVLKPKSLHGYFLYLIVSGELVQKRINAAVVGGAIPTLSQEIISKFVVPIPSLPEQQKIAECLSSLDELISAQAQKIEALKMHKKGLMQQLFPVTDEVQG